MAFYRTVVELHSKGFFILKRYFPPLVILGETPQRKLYSTIYFNLCTSNFLFKTNAMPSAVIQRKLLEYELLTNSKLSLYTLSLFICEL